MNITKCNPLKVGTFKGFKLVITTMEGDDNDHHSIELHYPDDERGEEDAPVLEEDIISCEILARTYPRGRGGCDAYCGPHFEKFQDDWYHDSQGSSDSFESYNVTYHDGNGHTYPCTLEFSEEEFQRIKTEKAK